MRLRLTAWYVALLAAAVTLLGVFVVSRLNAGLTGAVDRTLSGAIAQLVRGGDIDATAVTTAQILDDGRVVAWRGALGRTPLANAAGPAFTRTIAGEEYRIRASAAGAQLLVVAQSLDGVQDAADRVITLILIAGPAALLLAAAGGWWLAGKALRPVGRMAGEAERIEIDRLERRIPVPAPRDELARLATTLNAMLDRLARGVERRDRLVADASHELRSPLAAMRTELDVALDADEPSRAVLESAREEVDRLAHIVDDLLALARLDAGALAPEPAPVELLDVAHEVASRFAALAAIEVTGDPAHASADPRHVRRALANLVDNAVQASPDVRVKVWQRDGRAGISVSDSGPGVPEPDRERIFERFARVDEARGRGGSGLGLTIARELVEAGGGTLDLRGQNTFVITLRAARARP